MTGTKTLAMDMFTNPRFCEGILGIAQAHGPLGFWIQNLAPGMNPDATWRALMVVGALKDNRFETAVRELLVSPDSRVRAWACFALGQMRAEAALKQICALNSDTSLRVRVHASQAVQAMVGPEEAARHFPVRIPTSRRLVLISEDSRRFQTTLSELCSRMGFHVKTASSERETMALASALRPQAIITDNQKGKDNLSGLNMTWDLCRQADLHETIIFMLTADFVEPPFLWNGGDCFASKLLGLENLAHAIIEYFGRESQTH
jgi:CheY-like chemotaxis protein